MQVEGINLGKRERSPSSITNNDIIGYDQEELIMPGLLDSFYWRFFQLLTDGLTFSFMFVRSRKELNRIPVVVEEVIFCSELRAN